jgi:hypothetical protein
MERIQPLAGHCQTDKTATIFGHEIYHLRRNLYGRGGQISFIFAVLIIYDNNNPALSDFFNGFLNAVESQNTPLSKKSIVTINGIGRQKKITDYE